MSHALIVDDKEENLYYLRALLEASGWTVDAAFNGAEALIKARQAPPDLIISDLLMPVLDGFSLLRQWKADPRLNSIPFIVYTATYTQPEDEQLALNLGADAFILKPSEPEDFLARLREVQARSSGVRQPTAEDASLLERHSETLVRKLGEKMTQLEETNRILLSEQAELRMRDRAIQAVSQGIVIVDARVDDYPIIYASPSVEHLTGYTVAEMLGRNCRFLQGKETDPAAIAQLREAVRAGRGCTVELLNYRKDGSPFWNHLTISPVTDTDGRLTHFVAVQTDVTERIRLESQLRQAQKMEAIGRLAGGIAHDFNNILSVILGYSSLTLGKLAPENPLKRDIGEVFHAAERATDLVRQLLAFSRQQVLQPRVVDLTQLVFGMEAMLRRLLGAGVELSLHGADTVSSVRADSSQLEQIVMNLAVNARDAMSSGGKLTIEIANRDIAATDANNPDRIVPGSYVLLTITDTGTGMDPVTRERIFEPFFTTKEQGKGTGLGLCTVFGIVAQSKGQIGFESQVGQGTTFRVYLPRSELPPETAPAEIPAIAAYEGSETVLVVEDDEQVRAMTRDLLQRHGYHVIDAQNAGDALLTCAQYKARIDLLVADVVMPRMSGKQLAERLLRARPETKVLFMSGYADQATEDLGALGPGVPLLTKPILPAALLRKVREVLST